MRSPSQLLVCLVLLACAACSRSGQGFVPAPSSAPVQAANAAAPTAAKPPPSPQPIAADLLAEAHTFYAQRCSLCHGPTGRGDGVAASNLRPRPRSFLEPGWQASTTDDQVALIIVRGGSAVGRSMMMPASTDLADKPQLVQALVAVVRSFQPPATP